MLLVVMPIAIGNNNRPFFLEAVYGFDRLTMTLHMVGVLTDRFNE
jgi:hypothetical protein